MGEVRRSLQRDIRPEALLLRAVRSSWRSLMIRCGPDDLEVCVDLETAAISAPIINRQFLRRRAPATAIVSREEVSMM
jgi:hypothetical protein